MTNKRTTQATIIKSRKDAYSVACQLGERTIGATCGLNGINVTFVGYHRFTVASKPGLFWTGEIADLFWDNRKNVNDWLRAQYKGA